MAEKGHQSCGDIEQGRRDPHLDASDDDDSICFSDAENHSWHSPDNAGRSGSDLDGRRASSASCLEIDGIRESCRKSCVSDSSLEDQLESDDDLEMKVKADRYKRNCRICHLSLEKASPEPSIPIVLGCSCKDDLAAAHKHCAETWFKIKGNKTCEICGSIAHNVVVPGEAEVTEPWNEVTTSTAPPTPPSETRRFWQGHRFLNFLLACLVFAFVISWLFHFNVPG